MPRRAAQPSPGRSPVPARALSRPPCRPGSPASRARTPTRRSTTTRAALAPAAPSSSPAAWPSPAATPTSRRKSSRKAQQRCGGSVVEVPAYISPIAVIYNLPGVDRPAAVAGHDRRHLRRQDHQLERPGDRRGQPGQDVAGPGDHPGAPLRRVGHDRELHRLPVEGLAAARGRTSPTARGRSRAVRPRRARPASSARSRAAPARSVTPTRARPAASARRWSRWATSTPVRRRRLPRTCSPSPRASRAAATRASPSTWPARPGGGHLPDRAGVVPDGVLEVPGPAQADLVKGFLTYTTSAEGQKAAARRPGRRRCPSSCARRSARPITGITAGA